MKEFATALCLVFQQRLPLRKSHPDASIYARLTCCPALQSPTSSRLILASLGTLGRAALPIRSRVVRDIVTDIFDKLSLLEEQLDFRSRLFCLDLGNFEPFNQSLPCPVGLDDKYTAYGLASCTMQL